MAMQSVELACGRASAVFLARMRRGVNSLATVSAVAALIGLLGTVMGIINSFPGISGDPRSYIPAVAGRLSDALIPWALGLAVAIPAWCCYRYLLARLEDFETEMAAATQVLVNQLRVVGHTLQQSRSVQ
jgi:biopolymer transport protein ExbB/TolQ